MAQQRTRTCCLNQMLMRCCVCFGNPDRQMESCTELITSSEQNKLKSDVAAHCKSVCLCMYTISKAECMVEFSGTLQLLLWPHKHSF